MLNALLTAALICVAHTIYSFFIYVSNKDNMQRRTAATNSASASMLTTAIFLIIYAVVAIINHFVKW